jgi:transposase-like protein
MAPPSKYPHEFRRQAVALVLDSGTSFPARRSSRSHAACRAAISMTAQRSSVFARAPAARLS